MKTNYHTHTKRCLHAEGCEEDYVKEAIKQGLGILGMSDHAPYPDDRYGLRMPYDQLNDYIQSVQSLKKHYQKDIQLYLGLEIEYRKEDIPYYQQLRQMGVEYLVLGQHVYWKDGIGRNIYELEQTGSTASYVDYALSIKEAIESKCFEILAHPDVIFLNDFVWDENCEKACDIILDSIQQHTTVLEFNANGIRRGKKQFLDGYRYPYPHPRFWEKVAQRNLPVLVNSDCHSPFSLYDCSMKEAKQYAQDLNLNIIEVLSLTT